ncbi:hypothetical protein THASP1DRAFT_29616 [Thamnocephalis sphaerospora]|uniref:Transmembrane protein n=1 Tax=Thamnocephalis sphaerospora TaxID=78915 RepID=A0A4V1IWS6_9FUNG|nr:hypothetical protein THASP1DRAFT_29616 [Thamnocephalis sphaerospora]|eukprot:RKP08589.1 hypothetical protein THASP1DRAFT_29616 [Thamnocephalis sphaerospora]
MFIARVRSSSSARQPLPFEDQQSAAAPTEQHAEYVLNGPMPSARRRHARATTWSSICPFLLFALLGLLCPLMSWHIAGVSAQDNLVSRLAPSDASRLVLPNGDINPNQPTSAVLIMATPTATPTTQQRPPGSGSPTPSSSSVMTIIVTHVLAPFQTPNITIVRAAEENSSASVRASQVASSLVAAIVAASVICAFVVAGVLAV